MTGCAINPLIGPASQTRDVKCSERPRLWRKGVPYLQPSWAGIHAHESISYPSSTVHAICAPAIEMLRVMRSQCDNRFPGGILELFESPLLSPSAPALPPATEGDSSAWPLAGHGIWVVGSGSASAMGGIMLSQGRRKVSRNCLASLTKLLILMYKDEPPQGRTARVSDSSQLCHPRTWRRALLTISLYWDAQLLIQSNATTKG